MRSKKRARDLRLVIHRTARHAAARQGGIVEIAEAARVHRRDQLEPRRIGHVCVGPCDHGAPRFERLAQRFQRTAVEFEQLVEKQRAVMVLLLTAALSANAALITGLFATGVDGAGVALGDGATDTHYSILSPAQQGIVINQAPTPGSWVANTAAQRWIWEAATGLPVNVTHAFRTTFDLTGLDETTASLSSTAISEPGMLAVFRLGHAGLGFARRRRTS